LDPGDGCFYCSRCWRDFELQGIEEGGGGLVSGLVSEGEGGGVGGHYGEVNPGPFPAKNSKKDGGKGGVFARFWEEAVEGGGVGGREGGAGGDGGGDFSVISYNVLGEYHGQNF
jgi:hypothetical protein